MIDDYPADEVNIRYAFVDANNPRTEDDHVRLTVEFNLWLAEYTRQQREEAWTGGYRKGYSEGMYDIQPTSNPYRKAES